MAPIRPRVALFVTCLDDLHRPSIGFAAIRLLEQAGCQVEVPRAQTCCGQPAYIPVIARQRAIWPKRYSGYFRRL